MRKEREHKKREIIEKHVIKTGEIRKAYKSMIDKKNWIPKLKDKTGTDKAKRADILNIATEFYQTLYKKQKEDENTNIQTDNKNTHKIG